MPITIAPATSADCNLSEWTVAEADRERLIGAIAHLYLRQEGNAQRVIDALEPEPRPMRGRVAENVIRKLTAPTPAELSAMPRETERQQKDFNAARTRVWHRDGLLFQHISWIAARRAMPQAHMTAPHVRVADKGFDGFLLDINTGQNAIHRLVLCEDKASERPRQIITGSVWPEIRTIRNGERDDEILADLTTLLGSIPSLSQDAAEALVDAVLWEKVRQFRVSVATGEDMRRPEGFGHLLDGFESAAPGDKSGRIGGVLAFHEVRAGLSDLATAVAARVRTIAAPSEDRVGAEGV